MRLLWISSIAFPEANNALTGNNEFRSSGGWIVSSAEEIIKKEGIKLFVSFVSPYVNECKELEGESITYFVLPEGRKNSYYEQIYQKIGDAIKPDVVHVHGTEHPLGYCYIKACGNKNVVVSIQGVISKIGEHYCDGLSTKEILQNITIRDLIKGPIFTEKRSFLKKGVAERELLKNCKYVIGRTDFDKSFALSQNSNIIYYHCDETLRPPFYAGEWSYDSCTKHSIFLSQSYYPVKGLHFVLRALAIVTKNYTDITVRIAGIDFTRQGSDFANKLKRSGYGKIIGKMLNCLNLKDKVTFLGLLDAEQMKEEYLKSNLFICSSTCENSPNSLGEAQMLGVPCLASYVGGVPNMMPTDTNCLLYQHDNVELLAYNIGKIFEHSATWDGKREMEIARKRHDTLQNLSRMLSVYKEIVYKNEQ